MLSLHRVAIATLGIVLTTASPTFAAEQVGQAVLIKTAVTGANGPLTVKAPVHRDERIRTSSSGLGQFVFRDGTKLAVGWGSSVVIDKFVFDDTKSVKKLTIKAAKGTFRWISGNSSSSAYEIVTPAGTIGVRGTAFDVYVAANGTTAVVLLSGAARFCGSNGCRQLTRRCDCVIATRSGGVSDPRRVNPGMLRTLGSARALPFLSGDQRLSGGFQTGSGSCGLSMASLSEPKAQRSISQPPAPNPDRPNPPNKPDKPGKPDKPDKPGKSGKGKGNNGHGNDDDGFDSSNPGRGKAGRDNTDQDGTPGGGGKGKGGKGGKGGKSRD
ncbi:FecR domain-containing protein [Mesorhizobium sp. AaZ16]|uniref:FecR family protein n=1 Tax=Mesorhizobium sp. AaZ16 TaxID=3402289 RepID=UPI00374EAE0C